MKKERDYYDILGVSRDADAAAIKSAYRRLAKKYHPDSNKGNSEAEERFKEISEAYDVLGDEKKRKAYDRFGRAAFDGNSGHGFGENGNGGFREFHFEGSGQDMDDILKEFFGGSFRNGFGAGEYQRTGGFGTGGFGNPRGFRGGNGFGFEFGGEETSGNGSDLHAAAEITFEEAAFGCRKVIRFQDALGKVQTLEVTIPAGISDGKTLRLRGKGMPGVRGGEPGSLMLKIQVKEKPGFRREGQDVYTTAEIPFATAVLGGEATIRTLYGDVLCKIRPGTRSGTKIRLKGKGIVSMDRPSSYGDQYATVSIQVPADLSPDAKGKLREFEEQCRVDEKRRRGHVA